ncbi:uncharacterized protein RHO25_012419 [Cercospora beticola]|uniref:Ecp2 effector protein domain-containing protein n=1 Tax=Cercospora beticola TaxID=122368 RepID=A0ABZ0P857_CERBT|nr:hypothetical protein RHO25_012419 [Cercospora beticola]CAK1356435.1 unnamed protein product [Cercospora beticola]
MNFKKLLLLVLGALVTSTSARTKKSSWSSETHNAKATELVRCIEQMEATLIARPESQRYRGYQCGDRWYQWGSDLDWVLEKTNLFVFKKCKDGLVDAVLHSKDWLLCYVRGGWGGRIIAYSPLGHRATLAGDHTPYEWPPKGGE